MSPFEGQDNAGGNVAAHEFGHFLGNMEDYGEASNPKYTGSGRPVPIPERGSSESPSVMGEAYSAGGVGLERHLWRVLQEMNSSGDTMRNCTIKPVP